MAGWIFGDSRFRNEIFSLTDRKEEDYQQEEEGKPNEDGMGRDSDSLYGATVFSFSDIKHM